MRWEQDILPCFSVHKCTSAHLILHYVLNVPVRWARLMEAIREEVAASKSYLAILLLWLGHEGDVSDKYCGWKHPVATFLVHYGVVALTMTMVHDAVGVNTTGILAKDDVSKCQVAPELLQQRQLSVAIFLACYYCLFFSWRLVLQWKKDAFLVFAEFYRQTFLCSVTIFHAALGFYTGRPLIAEALCIAVGIDQLLWYVDLGAYILW